MFIFFGSFLTLDWNLEQSTEEKINSIYNFAWNLNLGLLHFTFFWNVFLIFSFCGSIFKENALNCVGSYLH